ncbi:scoloptoxin SSD20-like [Dermacentor variabilis]|uniref:scoloptoxin SSD20-like n=1 Tax=Dermacentor variabilis TaxID=34621 RepID=UPI003F5BA1EA
MSQRPSHSRCPGVTRCLRPGHLLGVSTWDWCSALWAASCSRTVRCTTTARRRIGSSSHSNSPSAGAKCSPTHGSSIWTGFGSMVLSRRTGVIFNDVIRNFDLPYELDQYNLSKSLRNQVAPGHRPLSTMTPSLVLRDGYGVAMALSGSGGGRIISGIAQVVMRVLWMDQTVKRASDWGRLHHQFIPDTLYAESTVSREIVDTLKFFGHKTEVQDTWPNDVMAMARRFGESRSADRIYATYDFRRQTNNFVDGE